MIVFAVVLSQYTRVTDDTQTEDIKTTYHDNSRTLQWNCNALLIITVLLSLHLADKNANGKQCAEPVCRDRISHPNTRPGVILLVKCRPGGEKGHEKAAFGDCLFVGIRPLYHNCAPVIKIAPRALKCPPGSIDNFLSIPRTHSPPITRLWSKTPLYCIYEFCLIWWQYEKSLSWRNALNVCGIQLFLQKQQGR